MRWLILPLTLLAFGAQAQPLDSRTMCPLASALTKVARAVDVSVANDPSVATMRGEEIVRAATQHDPSLLEPFGRVSVVARVEGRNSSVLVCTADGRVALMEDAGCSPQSDSHLWNADLPCGFTLDLAAVCVRNAAPSANLCR